MIIIAAKIREVGLSRILLEAVRRNLLEVELVHGLVQGAPFSIQMAREIVGCVADKIQVGVV